MTIETTRGDTNEALWEAPPEARSVSRARLQERWRAVRPPLDASTMRDLFTALYLDEVDGLVRHARRMGHPAAEAQQIAQESFVVLWGKLAEYDPERATIRTWLWGIHTNLEVGARRLAIRRGRWNIGPVDPEASPDPGSMVDPEGRLLARDSLRRAERALASLPPKLREVWVLQRIDGLTLVEIAEALNEKLTVVTGRLRQADHALRAKMQEGGARDDRAVLALLPLGASGDVLPALVERLRRIEPLSPGERERLLRRIEESLGVRFPRPPAALLRRWLPALGTHGAVATLSAALAITALGRPGAPPPQPTATATTALAAESSAAITPAAPPTASPPPTAPPIATASPTPASLPTPRAQGQGARTARPATPSYERFRQAQHALATNPDLTLRAVREERLAQGRRELSFDWVLLEVQALVRQGQQQAALTQARRFAAAHPGDSLADDVWRAAGAEPPRDG